MSAPLSALATAVGVIIAGVVVNVVVVGGGVVTAVVVATPLVLFSLSLTLFAGFIFLPQGWTIFFLWRSGAEL
jgi:hypothetical protein